MSSFRAFAAPRRSISSLADMRNIVVAVLIGVCVLGTVAFGWLRYTSMDARKFDNTQVVVTFSGAPTKCTVSLRDSSESHALPCADVSAYFRDQLRLPPGAMFATRDFGNTHGVEISTLISALKESGYRSVGVTRVAFITKPERAR